MPRAKSQRKPRSRTGQKRKTTRRRRHGGDKSLACEKSRSLLCSDDSDFKATLLQIHRALVREPFRDAILSLPLSQLTYIINKKDDDFEPQYVTQNLFSCFLRYVPRSSDTTSLSSSYNIQVDEVLARQLSGAKMFVYYLEDSAAITDADCYEVLCRYIHIVDEKLIDKSTLTSLLNLLKAISSALIQSATLEDGSSEQQLMRAKQLLDMETSKPEYGVFRSLDVVTAINKAYSDHSRKTGNTRSLALLSSRLLGIAQDITVHVIVLDSLLTKISPLCANKTAVIQSLSNPTTRCPIRSPDGSPAVQFLYFLTRASGKLQMLRVMIVSATDKVLYAFPFSPMYSDRSKETSTALTNVSLFNEKIKDTLLRATISSQTNKMFDLPFEYQNKPLNVDAYTKIPYFEFWMDFSKTVTNFLSSPTTASYVKSRDDVFDMLDNYFNVTYLMSVCHNIKNYALNFRKFTLQQVIETTSSLLSDCECLTTDDALLRSARAKLDSVIFGNARQGVAPNVNGIGNLPYGAIFIPPPVSPEETKSKKDFEPILRSIRYDKYKRFYNVFSKAVSSVVRRIDPQRVTSTSDPLMEIVQKILVQTNALKETDDGLESQTAVLKKLRDALKVNVFSTSTAYSSTPSQTAYSSPSSSAYSAPSSYSTPFNSSAPFPFPTTPSSLAGLSDEQRFRAIMSWKGGRSGKRL